MRCETPGNNIGERMVGLPAIDEKLVVRGK